MSFWDQLMAEQGVTVKVAEEVWRAPDYSGREVFDGEIVEDE